MKVVNLADRRPGIWIKLKWGAFRFGDLRLAIQKPGEI